MVMELTELDRKIINQLSGDLPTGKRPLATLARKVGLDESALLERIEGYVKSGILRRFAAVLAHREAGFAANALVVWRVPDDEVAEVAAVMSGFEEVSHCYERLSYPQWQYNIYTMIHGRDRAKCLAVVDKISSLTGITDYRVLFTVREFKKTSMRYFV
jgi:DNA-binding Lrp family transcriptional regulator